MPKFKRALPLVVSSALALALPMLATSRSARAGPGPKTVIKRTVKCFNAGKCPRKKKILRRGVWKAWKQTVKRYKKTRVTLMKRLRRETKWVLRYWHSAVRNKVSARYRRRALKLGVGKSVVAVARGQAVAMVRLQTWRSKSSGESDGLAYWVVGLKRKGSRWRVVGWDNVMNATLVFTMLSLP